MRFIFIVAITVIARSLMGQAILSDEGSQVEFKIKNFGTSVDGLFKGLQGNFHFDPATLPTAQFDVSIDANTIDTGIGMRDNHLRKKGYFDVDSYPRIRFASTKVTTSSNPGEYILTGNLTIKKTTKEISFPFTYSSTGSTALFKGQFQLNRRDFEVGGGSLTMADNLVVYLSVTAKK